MNLKVFSVYDSKTEAYMTPFFMRSKGEAIRGFADVVNDGQSTMCKYPHDYTLFEIGEWDDTTARLEPHATPISLGVAIEHKKESGSVTSLAAVK